VLKAKLESALGRRFQPEQCDHILALIDDTPTLDRTPVNRFVDLFFV
jgi:hypothetical protein